MCNFLNTKIVVEFDIENIPELFVRSLQRKTLCKDVLTINYYNDYISKPEIYRNRFYSRKMQAKRDTYDI